MAQIVIPKVAQPVENVKAQEASIVQEVKQPLGKSVVKDGITATVTKVEYTKDGFKVFYEIKNNSAKALTRSASMKFAIDNPKYLNELNRQGYGGSQGCTDYVYPEKGYSGNLEFHVFPSPFKERFKISEVTLIIQPEKQASYEIGTWIVP